MDKGSAQKIIDILTGLYSVYEYSIKEKSKDEVRAFRSYLGVKDYKVWIQKEVFEVAMIGSNVTYFSTSSAFKEVTAMQLADKDYQSSLIIKKLKMPTFKGIEENLFKEVEKVLASCSHLSLYDASDKAVSYGYMDLKSGTEYRLYPEQKGVLVIYQSKNSIKLDDGDMKLFMNRIKINEYQYHRELEEFGLKDKNEVRQEHMQIMTML
jgi:hypothetical protein